MSETTRRALVAVNRRFYECHAASFSASRGRPWQGWGRLLAHLAAPAEGMLRVLDLGCGNGRFATFLAARSHERIDYWGIDDSPALLETARRRLASPASSGGRLEPSWSRLDLTGAELPRLLSHRTFHLIALFGVLHHIPGLAARADLLARLAAHLDPRGVLAVSWWRFDRQSRWASKVVPWDDYNLEAPEPIDTADLEEGDHLLTWAGDRTAPRYCHLAGDDEVTHLAAASGLHTSARFTADGPSGDHNLYLVFVRSPCSS